MNLLKAAFSGISLLAFLLFAVPAAVEHAEITILPGQNEPDSGDPDENVNAGEHKALVLTNRDLPNSPAVVAGCELDNGMPHPFISGFKAVADSDGQDVRTYELARTASVGQVLDDIEKRGEEPATPSQLLWYARQISCGERRAATVVALGQVIKVTDLDLDKLRETGVLEMVAFPYVMALVAGKPDVMLVNQNTVFMAGMRFAVVKKLAKK